ncbi:hypothetical protein IWQ57_005633, partial [Coemansia nantahalensis]
RASTPDLPSADELLGIGRRPPLPARVAGALGGRAALDLPSSPPAYGGWSPRSSPPPGSDDEDSCRELDAIIGAAPRVFGRPVGLGHARAGPDYSDAVETVVLDSSDDEPALQPPVPGRPRLLARRAQSADVGPPSAPPTDPPGRSSPASELGSSGQQWSADDGHVSLSQAVTRKEQQDERARAAERRRAERAAEKQRAAREREFARAVSQANKKTVDPKLVARDATMLVDPGVLGLLPAKKQPEGGPEAHELFARFRDDGLPLRVADGGPACAVRWDVARRREWDPQRGLFVPLDPPRVVRATQAMVVLSSARFVALVSQARLARMLEIWRAALAATRLHVVVLGLQQLLRKAATADAHEFARQMRAYIKEGAVDGASSQQQQAATIGEEDIHRAVLAVQITCPWVTWFTECAGDARALGKLLWQTTADLALAEFRDTRADDADDDADSGVGPAAGFVTGEVAAALRVATVRSGVDLPDAWLRALAQIPKLTHPIAQAIAAHYPT